ncbi:MAG: FtsX-like permease family protein, partial [Melioribacteraceae bacterium]
LRSGAKSSIFRKTLVILQFTVSIGLIVSTAIVFSQLNYMRNKDLGFNQDHLVYVNVSGKLRENYKTVKNEFAKISSVLSITGSRDRPGIYGSNSGGIDWQGKDPEAALLVSFSGVDYRYTETMEIKMKDGRSFSAEFPADMAVDTVGNFLINESLEKVMGEGSAVGKSLDFLGIKGQIVGVMKDYHFSKVSSKIQPLALYLTDANINNLILRIKPENLTSTINQLSEAWRNVYTDFPFEFKFLNDDLDKMYRSETRMFDLLKYFAGVAIIIACLGLYGLSSFAAEQRTKEIGIRKVLGASELKLALLVSKEFVVLVLFSNLIAWPLAFYFMKDWLDTFAYRIELSYMFFIMSGIAALIITIITVSYQALRAAYANPVKALKYE